MCLSHLSDMIASEKGIPRSERHLQKNWRAKLAGCCCQHNNLEKEQGK